MNLELARPRRELAVEEEDRGVAGEDVRGSSGLFARPGE